MLTIHFWYIHGISNQPMGSHLMGIFKRITVLSSRSIMSMLCCSLVICNVCFFLSFVASRSDYGLCRINVFFNVVKSTRRQQGEQYSIYRVCFVNLECCIEYHTTDKAVCEETRYLAIPYRFISPVYTIAFNRARHGAKPGLV